MTEIGKDLTLIAEAMDDEFGIHSTSDEFDCDLFPILAVSTFGQVDLSHTAPADFANHFIDADAPANQRVRNLTRVLVSSRYWEALQ